jgi:uncharacterized protein with HEPN domain
MQMNERDAAYLWDMLQAARRIQDFTAGLSRQGYLESLLVQSAVERQLEIIGEAARRVSETFQQAHPEIPWRLIIGQRNVLAHQYGEIQQERLWQIVSFHILTLIAQLEVLMPSLPSNEET